MALSKTTRTLTANKNSKGKGAAARTSATPTDKKSTTTRPARATSATKTVDKLGKDVKSKVAKVAKADKAVARSDDKSARTTRSARAVKSVKLPQVEVASLRAGRPAREVDDRRVTTTRKADKFERIEKAEKADKARTARTRRAREPIASDIAEAMLGELGLAGEDSALEREAARGQREREILARLSVSVGRSDEMPNLELAADIVFADDVDAVAVLVAVIERHDDMHAPDAARVLCEVGTRAPDLLIGQAERLLSMIDDNRGEMLKFTMLALSPIASRYAEQLWDARDLFWQSLADVTQPADLAQAGAVRLLAALCAAGPDYARTLAGGLVDLLGKCMPKDVAFFAESVLPALGQAHSHRAKPVLDRRLKELTPAEVARLRRAQRAAQLGQPLPFAA